MANEIKLPNVISNAHAYIVEWLNELLVKYKSSFWDSAIIPLLATTFVDGSRYFIQEIYQGDGYKESGFIACFPTDTQDRMLMVFPNGTKEGNPIVYDGKPPYLYNNTDVDTLFEFDDDSILMRFYSNVTIPLYNKDGELRAEANIVFESWFGLNAPMLYVRSTEDNTIIGKGYLDMVFEGKKSGTYVVNNVPDESQPKFMVTNISKVVMTIDVPIFEGYNKSYKIKPRTAVAIPITEWTEYFFKTAKELGGLIITKQ